MNHLMLHEFHARLGARFAELNGAEVVNDYGDWRPEYQALREAAGVLDFSARTRLCLVGADRGRFLQGQVTNDVKRLRPGQGCYAAITNAKGKMEADLNIFCLPDELLLDLEPGLTQQITQRLEKYLVADDVQVVDAAPLYGLLSVQGPQAETVIRALGVFPNVPSEPLAVVSATDPALGEIYLARNARLATAGFDLFIPNASLGAAGDRMVTAAKTVGGAACGWQAFETARIEAGLPRYGVDMDETNLPLECGLEARAITYNKGCYIGQEVINRVHSVGHVNRELCGLRLADGLPGLPVRGDKIFQGGKEVGHITSAVRSPRLNANLALGYLRREARQSAAPLVWQSPGGESVLQVAALPFG